VTAVLPDLANTGLTPMPMSQRMFGRPPSCICDDVIILHPVIDFHDRNIFPYFHVVVVGLVVSVYESQLVYVQLADRLPDRQRQISLSPSLKAPPLRRVGLK